MRGHLRCLYSLQTHLTKEIMFQIYNLQVLSWFGLMVYTNIKQFYIGRYDILNSIPYIVI